MKRLLIACAGLIALAAIAATGFVLTAPPATAESGKPEAEAHIMDLDHKIIGRAVFTHVADGLEVHLSAHGLPPGVHAVQIHAVANCSDGFGAAGTRWNPRDRAQASTASGGGAPAREQDTVTVAADGTLNADLFFPAATIQPGPMTVMDEDGSSLVIHSGADDKTQPAGNSGDRIACGTIGYIPINIEPLTKPD